MGPWWSGDFFSKRAAEIEAATREHVILTLIAVGIGFAIALPLAILAHRRPRFASPLLGITGAIYTIPSLALFALLLPWTGLSRTTVEVGLVGYTLLILIRNTLTGLTGVPADVVDAARGMGYGSRALLVRVELPLAILAHRRPRFASPLLGITGAIYTIPSLALFALLLPWTGLSRTTVEVGLVGYTLLILIRNTLTGLTGVPADVVDAARGMGYGSRALLVRVELPLAMPAIIAGLRIATVSTIALVTVGAEVSYGGLGRLILQGLQDQYPAEAVGASVLCVGLALVADLLLVGVQRLVTPWARRR